MINQLIVEFKLTVNVKEPVLVASVTKIIYLIQLFLKMQSGCLLQQSKSSASLTVLFLEFYLLLIVLHLDSVQFLDSSIKKRFR